MVLLATAEGAQREFAHQRRPGVILEYTPGGRITRFPVPGVPGALGYEVSTRDHQPAANVTWVQGRCVLTVGNQGPYPLARPLSAGARAIYLRTNGRCP